MSTSAIEAVFKDGVFRPLTSVTIPDGKHVRLVVQVDEPTHPIVDEPMHPILELAGAVYAGLSDQEVDEIERIALDRTSFFSERTKE